MDAARKVVPGRCMLALLALLLAACEAPLDLAGVEQQSRQPVRRYDQFQAVTQVGDTVVVVGSHGAVLSSADGGRSWQRRELDGAPLLTTVVDCPDGTLAALDERRQVWLSSDHGGSWQAHPLDGPEMPLALDCDPVGRLWAVGTFSTVWSSADHGASWAQQSFGEDVLLNSVQFVDAKTGFITGEFGSVATSVDGGATWELVNGLPGEFYPQASLFLDRERGWSVGLGGTVLHTTDGGQSWDEQSTPTGNALYGLAARAGQLYAVGEHGTVLVLRDGAWHAVEQERKSFTYLRAALPLADDELLVLGGGGSLYRVPVGVTLAGGG